MPITVLLGARQLGKTSLMDSLEIPKFKIDGQTTEGQEIFDKTSDVEALLKIKINKDLNKINEKPINFNLLVL